MNFKKRKKEKNFWKFNSSLLKEQNCIKEIKDTILRVKEQYMLPIYNLEMLDNISNNDLQFTISNQLFLDVLLMEIRKTVINYSIKKKREDIEKEKQLESEINNIDLKQNKTEEDLLLKSTKENSLIELRKSKIDGIIIRSKARWAAQGEKVTKYFCNLENRHFVSKQMFKLINNRGEEITDTNIMVNEAKKFYEQLYKKREVRDIGVDEMVKTLPKLNEERSGSLEGQITYEEAAKEENMKNDKSPGTVKLKRNK